MNVLISFAFLVMLVGMAVLFASFAEDGVSSRPCIGLQDITWHQERSRSGVSLTCNRDIMQRNRREQVAQ